MQPGPQPPAAPQAGTPRNRWYAWVSFTTDYGLADGFVAACVGVIAGIAPHVRVIDVSHQIRPQDVRGGALTLAQTAPYLPPAVHLAVVDPGVGTERRGIAVVTPRGLLVGPDNGLIVPAARALGGVLAAYHLADPAFWLPTRSATFHGRDIFAPVTAHLANGADPSRLGPPIEPAALVALPERPPELRGGYLTAEVQLVDHFGTLQLAAGAEHLAALEVDVGAPIAVHASNGEPGPARVGRTFADAAPGELVVYVDSAGCLAVAVNGGSAAERLGVTTGTTLTLANPERR